MKRYYDNTNDEWLKSKRRELDECCPDKSLNHGNINNLVGQEYSNFEDINPINKTNFSFNPFDDQDSFNLESINQGFSNIMSQNNSYDHKHIEILSNQNINYNNNETNGIQINNFNITQINNFNTSQISFQQFNNPAYAININTNQQSLNNIAHQNNYNNQMSIQTPFQQSNNLDHGNLQNNEVYNFNPKKDMIGLQQLGNGIRIMINIDGIRNVKNKLFNRMNLVPKTNNKYKILLEKYNKLQNIIIKSLKERDKSEDYKDGILFVLDEKYCINNKKKIQKYINNFDTQNKNIFFLFINKIQQCINDFDKPNCKIFNSFKNKYKKVSSDLNNKKNIKLISTDKIFIEIDKIYNIYKELIGIISRKKFEKLYF